MNTKQKKQLDADLLNIRSQRLSRDLLGFHQLSGVSTNQLAAEISRFAVFNNRRNNPNSLSASIAPQTVESFMTLSNKPHQRISDAVCDFLLAHFGVPATMYAVHPAGVVAARAEAERFSAQHLDPAVLNLAQGWFVMRGGWHEYSMLIEISFVREWKVLLCRGVFVDHSDRSENSTKSIQYLDGYAVVTRKNLVLNLKDRDNNPFVVFCDVKLGPFDNDEISTPYFALTKATVSAPESYGPISGELFDEFPPFNDRSTYIRAARRSRRVLGLTVDIAHIGQFEREEYAKQYRHDIFERIRGLSPFLLLRLKKWPADVTFNNSRLFDVFKLRTLVGRLQAEHQDHQRALYNGFRSIEGTDILSWMEQ